MAQLIKCPVCGKNKSDNARQCPSCGYKTPIYHTLWFWLLIIIFIGLLIYYMLPINHIVSISFNREEQITEEPIETLEDEKIQAEEENAKIEEPIEVEEEYTPIDVDELLLAFQEDPTSVQCYAGSDLLIRGYISTLDEGENYYFIISGMEDNEYYSNFYIYVSEEQRALLQYYYTYGDIITAYIHCNEVNSDVGFLCDLNWFVS